MRKGFFIFAIISVSLILLGNSPSPIDSIKLKDLSSNSILYNQLELQSAESLGEIILLPKDPFNQREAAAMISRIDGLPSSMLEKVRDKKITVKLFEGKLTDNRSARNLSGISPRGYKSDKKWDEVPGIGGSKTVLVKIGYSEKGKGHGSANLELHELAHSVDRYVYNEIRYNQKFLKVWKQERSILFPGQAYFLTFPEEYFAEAFAMYFVGGKYADELQEKAPATYEFIQGLN